MPDTGTFIFNRRLTGLPAGAYAAEISPTLQSGSWNPLGILSAVPHPELPGFEQVTVQVPGYPQLRPPARDRRSMSLRATPWSYICLNRLRTANHLLSFLKCI